MFYTIKLSFVKTLDFSEEVRYAFIRRLKDV